MTPLGRPSDQSTLALLQATAVLVAITCVLGATVAWYHLRPMWAVYTVVGVLTGHVWALALECALAAWHNRHDQQLRASRSEWIAAWWKETRMAPRVFAWRQPFRWRELPDTVSTGPGAPGAVVMIHGFVCNRGFWLPWMTALRHRGVPYASVNLEPVFASIDAYIPLIEEAVARAEKLSCMPPALVCHSMGGLAARAWLASARGNAARVRKVITIGTPHRGTWLARLSHLENGQQMQPGGPWLVDLAKREASLQPAPPSSLFVCWYANTDNVVFPARTATMPTADNRLIRGAAHVDLAFHPRVMSESLSILTSASNSPIERTAS